MTILRTGKQKRGKRELGDGEPVGRTLLGLKLFPHGVLRGAGERSEEGFMLNSLRETRRAKSEQWGVNGRKARTTPNVRKGESIPIYLLKQTT